MKHAINTKLFNPTHCRTWVKVKCIETGETFESIIDASRKTGINNNSICCCANGKSKTAGGYRWIKI